MAQSTIRKDLRAATRELSEAEQKQLLEYAERLAKRSEKETQKDFSRESELDSKRPSYLAMANPEEYKFRKENEDNPYL